MFAVWGRIVYRHRLLVLAGSLLVLAVAIVILLQGGELRDTSSASSESSRANHLIYTQLAPVSTSASGPTFDLVFHSATLHATDHAFQTAMQNALGPLQQNPAVASLLTPYQSSGTHSTALLSPDRSSALAIVTLDTNFSTARNEYPQLRALVHSPTLQIYGTGDVAISHAFNAYLASDLSRAERISLPASLVLLLLVFGTVIAALLPLGVGVLSLIAGIAGIFALTHITDVSQYALNIVTLIGLGVAIDYSLFIVTRFREELAQGAGVEQALCTALATAGRAIAFSGLTVAIGLSGLLFYQGTILASMGLAGTLVVICAVFYGLTFLPALLALLGRRINWLRLPLGGGRTQERLWRGLATGVMKRPLLVSGVVLTLLIITGSPFLQLRLSGGSVSMLPPQAEEQKGYLLVSNFPGQNETAINVVVSFSSGSPLTSERIGALYDLNKRLQALPHVTRVESAFSLNLAHSRAAYQRLNALSLLLAPPAVRTQLAQYLGSQIVLFRLITTQPATGDAARNIVKAARAIGSVPAGGTILVGGDTASDLDYVAQVLADTPAAILYIVAMTYLVLFLLLGSVLLPLKAVLTDILSISTSFGAMVWIFQQGHLSSALNFTPTSLDPILPVLLFCIVFGLSMDYEVLLLSRMKEIYDQTGDNRRAIAEGLTRSGRLITGAAAIMLAVFVAFALANVLFIKAIGLGMALAVVVDATVVRALLVPAIMRLLGDLNWWAPRPLAQLYQRLNLGEKHTTPPLNDVA